MLVNSCKLMSHFRHSCPEKYRFACSLKNLNLFSPIYSQNNYWWSVEGSSLEFWFLLPMILMCNQLVSEMHFSHGMGPGSWVTILVLRASLRLTEFLTAPSSCWGNAGTQGVCEAAHGLSLMSCVAGDLTSLWLSSRSCDCAVALSAGSCASWPRPPKGRGLQALSSVSGQYCEGSEAQIS